MLAVNRGIELGLFDLVFAGHVGNIDKLTADDFKHAMNRLMGGGRVECVTEGPASRQRRRLVVAGGAQ